MNYTEKEFEELVRKYESTIYSVCYMYSDSKEQTDDLFQESLTNIWRSLPSYRKECNLNSWVYRTTLNTCLSYKRKKQIKTEAPQATLRSFSALSTAMTNLKQFRFRRIL